MHGLHHQRDEGYISISLVKLCLCLYLLPTGDSKHAEGAVIALYKVFIGDLDKVKYHETLYPPFHISFVPL